MSPPVLILSLPLPNFGDRRTRRTVPMPCSVSLGPLISVVLISRHPRVKRRRLTDPFIGAPYPYIIDVHVAIQPIRRRGLRGRGSDADGPADEEAVRGRNCVPVCSDAHRSIDAQSGAIADRNYPRRTYNNGPTITSKVRISRRDHPSVDARRSGIIGRQGHALGVEFADRQQEHARRQPWPQEARLIGQRQADVNAAFHGYA